MDPRRILTVSLALLLLGWSGVQAGEVEHAGRAAQAQAGESAPGVMAPIPDPPPRGRARKATAPRPGARAEVGRALALVSGPAAIGDANQRARETSRAAAFVGGVQVFAYDPGRIYEVWTAPLRVTTLTLGPGESVLSMAAGDTVRWQIGQTVSGDGAAQRAHVMIKPLEQGLETNLVLATSQRVYFVQLRSGSPRTFNAAVAWDIGAVLTTVGAPVPEPARPDPVVSPAGPLDARFRIEAGRRPPPWTPLAVMTDGARTFLRFPESLGSTEAPGLFVLGPGGERRLVNYRQQGGLWVVDQVLDSAELRIGDARGEAVRIIRQGERP